MDHNQDKEKQLRDKASQLFLKYHSYVRTIAFRLAPSPSLREDIVQDVFIEFVGSASKWDLDRDVKSLLRGMTRNKAREHWRQWLKGLPENLRRIALMLDRNQNEETVLDDSDFEEQVTALSICYDKLPEQSRSLIEAYYFAMKSTTDIATETGRHTSSLYTALFRVRGLLKRCVESVLRAREVE